MSDLVDRAIRRAEIRVRRIVESDAGAAGITGALVGLAAGALIEHSGDDPLGIDRTGVLKERASRIVSKASYATARMTNVLDPGNPLSSGAVGFEFGQELTNPWRDRRKPISTREPAAKAFPEPNEPGEFPEVDVADRFYRIVKREVPDTDGTDHKYRALGDELNRMVVEGSHDVLVRSTAAQVCKGLRTAREKAAAVHVWVQRSIRYVYDEDSPYLAEHPDEIQPEWNGALEVFADPAITLKNRWGDCDDTSSLIAAMLRTQGVYTFLRLISQGHPSVFSHIYPVARLEDGSEFPIDPTPIRDGDGWLFMPNGWELNDGVTGRMDLVLQPLPGQAG